MDWVEESDGREMGTTIIEQQLKKRLIKTIFKSSPKDMYTDFRERGR